MAAILLLILVLRGSPAPQGERSSINPRHLGMAKYLQDFGYIDRKFDLTSMPLEEFNQLTKSALKEFQNFHELPQTGSI